MRSSEFLFNQVNTLTSNWENYLQMVIEGIIIIAVTVAVGSSNSSPSYNSMIILLIICLGHIFCNCSDLRGWMDIELALKAAVYECL